MELYIPPPTAFLPKLPPPKPLVPPVPLVPIPDLPEILHAPEGAYTLNKELFPSIGTPAAPLSYDIRPTAPSAASFIGGAGGFIVAPPGPPGGPGTGQTAMSFGSTIVNGQAQPAFPVRFSFINVWFPPKAPGQTGLGGMFGGGAGKNDPTSPTAGKQALGGQQPANMTGYEPSLASSDSDPPSSEIPYGSIQPGDVPAGALPQQSKGNMFSKKNAAGWPRPKNNLRSSNSTFVTRLQAMDNLPKLMAEKGRNGGEMVRWGFWNLGRTFGWGEEGGKIKDPMARVTFSQVPTCHCISPHTASSDRIDIIVGFASGDIVWLDFILGRYTRINKGGILNNNTILSVQFDPRNPHFFLAAFSDSTIIQFNLFAEDPAATVQASPLPWIPYFESAAGSGDVITMDVDRRAGGVVGEDTGDVYEDKMITWKNEEWAVQLTEREKKSGERSPWAGKNPCSITKLGKKNLTGMAFSTDGQSLAVISDDGLLRIIDVVENRLTDTFAGYFSALDCLAWSPDSRFIAVGGQDDLITLLSPRESRVVARCQGHTAFVTSIAFDPGRGEGRGYRFASVGEDGKLILWDFTAASLHRPRHHHVNSRIAGSTVSLNATGRSQSHLPLNSGTQTTGNQGHYHPAPPRGEVALLQPVMARLVEGNLLTGVHISPQAILTISRAAQLKWWQRPKRQSSAKTKQPSGGGGVAGLKSPREGITA